MAARTWNAVRASRLGPRAVAKVTSRAEDQIRALTLRELRQGLDLTQAESRADHRISTLRRYVEALGGEIEITAVIGNRRVKLTDV